jgi:hypothetical protein
VEGQLGSLWSEWFEGVRMRYESEPGNTQCVSILVLPSADPARLYGVLAQIGNLNLKLISVLRKEQTHD